DAAQCDGLSRDPRAVVSLRQLVHPGTEPPNGAMMLLTVVGLGANVASALCWPTRRGSNAGHLTRKSPESGAGNGGTTRPAESVSGIPAGDTSFLTLVSGPSQCRIEAARRDGNVPSMERVESSNEGSRERSSKPCGDPASVVAGTTLAPRSHEARTLHGG